MESEEPALPYHITTVSDGPPIARAKGNKKLKLYISDGPGPESYESSGLQCIPYATSGQRVAVFVVGASGSGKSTWISQAIKTMKHKDVILFTTAEDLDPAYGKRVIKIDYMNDPSIIEDFDITELEESICIFDDFDNSTNSAVNSAMGRIIKTVLENGRKLKVDVFVVSHNPRDYMRTRTLILQCQTYVLFPQTNRNASMKFLKEYFDDDRDFLTNVKRLTDGGRFTWVALHKNAPRYMLTERSAHLLK